MLPDVMEPVTRDALILLTIMPPKKMQDQGQAHEILIYQTAM